MVYVIHQSELDQLQKLIPGFVAVLMVLLQMMVEDEPDLYRRLNGQAQG